ncbi:MAG: hypothetical protein R3C62_23280 [Chloroflexota bacterium]
MSKGKTAVSSPHFPHSPHPQHKQWTMETAVKWPVKMVYNRFASN